MEFEELYSTVEGLIAVIGILLIPFLLVFLAGIILIIIAKWQVFKKAGKPGWAAIVPFYNNWVLCELSGINLWFFLGLMASAIVSLLHLSQLEDIAALIVLVTEFFVNYNVAKKFGKGTGFAIGLTLLPFIFYPILGFSSKNVYNDVSVSQFGPIKEK